MIKKYTIFCLIVGNGREWIKIRKERVDEMD